SQALRDGTQRRDGTRVEDRDSRGLASARGSGFGAMSWGPRKLFARYAAALMGFTAIVVVAIGAIYLGVLYREVREAASQVQRAEARVAAARIEQFLGRIRASAAETASLPWAAGVLPARERREEYHRLMKLLPAVSEIAWVDDAGHERLRVS